jgi:dCTP deaminase
MILSDSQIKKLALENDMIIPFSSKLVSEKEGRKIISYGLSSYGYDLKLSRSTFKIFSSNLNNFHGIVDPKKFDSSFLITANIQYDEDGSEYFILPPNTYALGVAFEKLKIPRDVIAIFLTKSTYARCGVICNVTPAEPEWSGYLTLEISNSASTPCKIYCNEGIVQALFFQNENYPCNVSYSDRKGKYQNQPQKITFSRV